jgi:hypothetical protein
LPEPIGADPGRLGLSAEEEARVGEILSALPAEAAEVRAAITRLLFEVIAIFEGRLMTPSDVDETLAWLADTLPALFAGDDAPGDPGGILTLFTRHAMIQARGAVLHRLAWARRN